MLHQDSIATKTLKTMPAEVFFVFIFCLVTHKPIETLDIDIRRLIFICYQ